MKSIIWVKAHLKEENASKPESVMMTGMETMRLTYRLKVVRQNMDIRRIRNIKLKKKLHLQKHVQERMLRTYV
eukprot:1757938-Heterocapsa_arctica.AAC.1